MRKPVLGETLYALNVGYAARGVAQELTPVVVTKVGRNYFTVDGGWKATQFHISNWRQKTEYMADFYLYESEQAWHDERESAELCRTIGKAFEHGRNNENLSLDTLRKIHNLMEASE